MRILVVTNTGLNSQSFFDKDNLLLMSAKKLGIELDIKENSEILYKFTNDGIKLDLPTYDAVLFYSKDIFLANAMEKCGLKVFNSSTCISNCDNKARTYQLLSQHLVPIPETYIIPLTFYYNKTDYDKFIEKLELNLSYPFIAKKWYGSEGKQVFLIRSKEELKHLIETENGRELLFQKYYEECHGVDLRLNVIDNKVVSAIKRKSNSNDFRANLSIGGTAEKYLPTNEEIDIAIKASKALDSDFCGVDILQTKNGPVVCEVNSNARLKNVYHYCNINVAELIFEYIKEKIEK